MFLNEAPVSKRSVVVNPRKRREPVVAVNLHLVNRRAADRDDAMGRDWYGWDPYATDEELWETNRGVWRLRKGPLDERFATLSHYGVIQVVAEIAGRERYGDEWALIGTVLQPGDPVRDALVNRPAPKQRNPVAYLPTAELDALSTAERAQLQARERLTMIATWNPEHWHWNERDEEAAATKLGRIVRGRWSTGSRRGGVEPGDRVFLLKQGDEPRGIMGSGTCASRVFQDEHWDITRVNDANYVQIEWDTLLTERELLPHAELTARIPVGGIWAPQSSGTILSSEIGAALEAVWAEHLQQPAPVPPRTSPRQGWQLDKERRKKIEDAAQARLEAHFCREGWAVKDVRYGNSFDAIATKAGELSLYLEAKGTETTGASVIVSKGEVAWAQNRPGQCILGILSDVRFFPNGDVDPGSGTFRLFHWNPDEGVLAPREYDWTPPTSGQLRP